MTGLAVALLGPLVLAVASERWNPGPARTGESLLAQGVLAAMVAFVLWLGLGREGLTPEVTGLRAPSWQSVALGALLALFFIRVYGPLISRLLQRLQVGNFGAGIAKLDALPLWLVCLAVLIGGPAEEILYRGYAIARLESLTGSVLLAAAIPIAVFALAHVPMWGWAPALTTALAAAIFSGVFVWTRDLWPNAIAHVATDFAGIVLAQCSRRAQKANWLRSANTS